MKFGTQDHLTTWLLPLLVVMLPLIGNVLADPANVSWDLWLRGSMLAFGTGLSRYAVTLATQRPQTTKRRKTRRSPSTGPPGGAA